MSWFEQSVELRDNFVPCAELGRINCGTNLAARCSVRIDNVGRRSSYLTETAAPSAVRSITFQNGRVLDRIVSGGCESMLRLSGPENYGDASRRSRNLAARVVRNFRWT